MNKEQLHEFRKQIDACIQKAQADLGSPETANKDYPRRMSLVHTKLQEANLWLNQCLEAMGSELPKEHQDKA